MANTYRAKHAPLPFLSTCVAWPENELEALNHMIAQKVSIKRAAFLRHVDTKELARIELSLGYFKHPRAGLTMAGDWHVNYWRSRLWGRWVYGFDWSCIEHVFSWPKGVPADGPA